METMDPTPPRTGLGRRKLAPVPWRHDGCDLIQPFVDGEVPRFDETMVRDSIARASLACDRIDTLERMLNRELWRIGYVGRLEFDDPDRSVARIEVAGTH